MTAIKDKLQLQTAAIKDTVTNREFSKFRMMSCFLVHKTNDVAIFTCFILFSVVEQLPRNSSASKGCC